VFVPTAQVLPVEQRFPFGGRLGKGRFSGERNRPDAGERQDDEQSFERRMTASQLE
jgi:hypothetical protein